MEHKKETERTSNSERAKDGRNFLIFSTRKLNNY